MHALKSLNLSQGRSPRVSSRTHEHATPIGTAYAYLHLVKQGDAVTLLNEVQPAKGVPVSGTVQLVTHADPIKSQDVRHPTATLLIVRLACTYIDSKKRRHISDAPIPLLPSVRAHEYHACLATLPSRLGRIFRLFSLPLGAI